MGGIVARAEWGRQGVGSRLGGTGLGCFGQSCDWVRNEKDSHVVRRGGGRDRKTRPVGWADRSRRGMARRGVWLGWAGLDEGCRLGGDGSGLVGLGSREAWLGWAWHVVRVGVAWPGLSLGMV
jgi:hypothetical protein